MGGLVVDGFPAFFWGGSLVGQFSRFLVLYDIIGIICIYSIYIVIGCWVFFFKKIVDSVVMLFLLVVMFWKKN